MIKCEIGGIDLAQQDRMKYWTYSANYKGDKMAETKDMIFGGDYYGSLKRDGYWAGFYKNMNGEMALYSRTRGVNGDYADNYEKVPHLHEFFNLIPNGTILVGELYLPDDEGSKKVTSLLGCLTEKAIMRQKNKPLHFYIFDCWAFNGYSHIKTEALTRFEMLPKIEAKYGSAYVDYAVYYNGKELWSMIQKYLAEGREGVVITRRDCPVYFKRTPARMTLKIKKELQETIDCFLTGRATAPTRLYNGKNLIEWEYWENELTDEKIHGRLYQEKIKDKPYLMPITKPYFNGWAGSLEIAVLRDGVIHPIGFLSGLTDEMKEHFKDYKNRVIEITAMEIGYDENGKFSGLRHAKMLQFRDDLNIEDCQYDRYFK